MHRPKPAGDLPRRSACEVKMDPYIKDFAQVIAWLVASIGGVVAALKAVAELRRANQERADALLERKEQFRWRQAEMARSILDQAWSDPHARTAMRMLDWSGLIFDDGGRKTKQITPPDIYKALRTENTIFGPDAQFIRDCFDQLFDYFERIEHYLYIDLVNWQDIEGRFRYYVELLANQKALYSNFLTTYNYSGCLKHLQRYKSWSEA